MAALGLRGARVIMLDVGHTAPRLPRVEESVLSMRRSSRDIGALAVGDGYQGLRNAFERTTSLKLKSPGTEFVIRGSEQLAPVDSQTFAPVISLALGGFGNAWGAGVYRFGEEDMTGFPIGPDQLAPHYDTVSEHIGIAGAEDDLNAEFGQEPHLQPPLRLSRNCAAILAAYERRRKATEEAGLKIGRSRLAVLSQPHRGRSAYEYRSAEFYQCGDPAIYNPAFTIRELIDDESIQYEGGWMALRFRETPDSVEVLASRGSEQRTFAARRLLLAAGSLNSARIALRSFDDFETYLPLLDNPMMCFPLLHPGSLGAPVEERESGVAQLNLVYRHEGITYQGSIYACRGTLLSDVLSDLPFALRSNLRLLRLLLPATSMLMLFCAAGPESSNFLRLQSNGTLEAGYAWTPPPGAAQRLAGLLGELGCRTSARLCRVPPMGSGIHYAGTLPMRERPGRFECDSRGLLGETRSVYVCDGAWLPRLPAKNLTFTIMANAMRVAAGVREGLR